jgi:hypothetical protein
MICEIKNTTIRRLNSMVRHQVKAVTSYYIIEKYTPQGVYISGQYYRFTDVYDISKKFRMWCDADTISSMEVDDITNIDGVDILIKHL